ncbi:MAG: branched-chain amino acid ABC transporter permease [Lentisphaeria bacterium]|nr:branched-chain amino acid ABC transporter permease [Lentisphaeria bacterium]
MQVFFNGICNGMLIALFAVAFSIVYIPTGVFYIALAGIYVFAAYITMQMLQWTGSWQLAFSAALIACIVLSMLFDRFNHLPLKKRQASDGAHMISSLGLYMIMVQICALIWGNDPRSLRVIPQKTLVLPGISMAYSQIAVLVFGAIILGAFLFWTECSGIGLRLRALANNPDQLALLGCNTNRMRLVSFGISGALAALAGILQACDLGFDPHTGMPALMLAIVASIIGGRNNLIGPVVGGLILGIVRSLVVWYTSARWQDTVTFAILTLFLFCRPEGIFGLKERIEAGK